MTAMLRLIKDSDINYKRIAVIGCGGSGKSYFSLKLAAFLNLQCYHLDRLFWQPNWVETPKNKFVKIVRDVADKDAWIIDGNYGSTMEIRFQRAEIVYFLDMPTELCLESEQKRRGTKRADLPEYLVENVDLEFIDYIKNFNQNHRNKIIELMEKYPDVKVVTFQSREEVNSYLSELELHK